jgi:hypothetical protein
LALAGEEARQRGLAGAVAADEADLVAGGHTERDVRQKEPGADSHLDVACGDHVITLRISAWTDSSCEDEVRS